ncbi:hypothetical protein GBA52_013531 [Prunus armeniaca]|nr:hypothetical protein GBA52_013531 [Prunus armeniaca]
MHTKINGPPTDSQPDTHAQTIPTQEEILRISHNIDLPFFPKGGEGAGEQCCDVFNMHYANPNVDGVHSPEIDEIERMCGTACNNGSYAFLNKTFKTHF